MTDFFFETLNNFVTLETLNKMINGRHCFPVLKMDKKSLSRPFGSIVVDFFKMRGVREISKQ